MTHYKSALEKVIGADEQPTQKHKTTLRLSITIEQYLKLLKHNKLSEFPTFQRGSVAKPDWMRAIITTIFRGLDLPKFVLWVKDGNLLDDIREAQNDDEKFNILFNSEKGIQYPIIDALQRTHAIRKFND